MRAELLFARLTGPTVAELRAAVERELAVVRALLEQAGLPTCDLVSAKPEFTVLRDDGRIVAAGALVRFGSAALVRSVVVAGDRRGVGLGRIIVDELERGARGSLRTRAIAPSSAVTFRGTFR